MTRICKIILLLLLLPTIVAADSEYCNPYPNDITTSIIHEGNWFNITFTSPSCYICTDNGAGYGDVDCIPCGDTSFTSNVTCVIIPGSVQFTDTTPDLTITGYYWDFGDGENSTLEDPVHTYATAGIYTINHSTTNPSGTTWINATGYLTVRGSGDTCITTTVTYDNGIEMKSFDVPLDPAVALVAIAGVAMVVLRRARK